MSDPLEGTTSTGIIVTGAARHRVPAPYEPVLGDVVTAFSDRPGASVYLFGSVANGTARAPVSDVDVLAIGLDGAAADRLTTALSHRYAQLCREVSIGAAPADALDRDGDEAYGFRVFVRHYCVHLVGPTRGGPSDFPADEQAARGFNGDIDIHLDRWRRALADGHDPAALGRRIARKTLLAAAGIASVATGQWTTDRESGASWWATHAPRDAAEIALLLAWASDQVPATRPAHDRSLAVAANIAEEFSRSIGLWDAR